MSQLIFYFIPFMLFQMNSSLLPSSFFSFQSEVGSINISIFMFHLFILTGFQMIFFFLSTGPISFAYLISSISILLIDAISLPL